MAEASDAFPIFGGRDRALEMPAGRGDVARTARDRRIQDVRVGPSVRARETPQRADRTHRCLLQLRVSARVRRRDRGTPKQEVPVHAQQSRAR